MPQLASHLHNKSSVSSTLHKTRPRQNRLKGEYFVSSAQDSPASPDPFPPSEYGEFLRMMDETDSFQFLPRGWDTYGAESPNERSISNAKQVLKLSFTSGFRPVRVTPSPEGGVAVCYEENGMYADIECFNTGEIFALTSDHRSQPVWEINEQLTDLAQTINRIRAYFITG